MRAIGIDVGGSRIRAVRWNGTRVEKLAVANTPQSAAALTRVLRRMLNGLEEGMRLPTGGGFAGHVSSTTIISSRNNRFLKGYHVAHALERPISLDNDARAFARAEYLKGAAKGAPRALFFTFGTGVGRAYGVQGEIKKVKRFEYPEKWERQYQRVKGVAALAPFLVEHLVPLVHTYKPHVIVVGGGVAEKKDFVVAFRHELRAKGFKGVVAPAKLGTLAGAIGAALLAKRG